MITNVYLENFRCFKKMNLSLMKTAKEPKSTIVIYGENGAGKSSIVSVFTFLNELIFSYRYKHFYSSETFKEIYNVNNHNPDDLKKYLTPDIIGLIKRNKLINSTGKQMTISIEFLLGNKKGIYTLGFDDRYIILEELKFEKKHNLSLIFSYSNDKKDDWFDDSYIFQNDKFKDEINYAFDSNRGNYTYLSILLDSILEKNEDFIKTSLNNELIYFIHSIGFLTLYNDDTESKKNAFNRFQTKSIYTGTTDLENKKRLEKEKDQLSFFYKSINKNILDVYYLFKEENNKLKYDLTFKIKRNNEILDLPFDYLSKGTRNLLNIFVILKKLSRGFTVIVDEVDTGIHDNVIMNLIKQISDNKISGFGQLIATSHNTSLMNVLNIHQVYIIEDSENTINVLPLSKNKTNIQANNNIFKNYLNGKYNGVPIISFDLEDFCKITKIK